MPNLLQVQEELRSCPQPLDQVRGKYLRQLHDKTGRNLICYYSGFLQKPEVSATRLMIDDADKNAFMACAHQLDRDKGCDLLLHTQGGLLEATESLVDYLRQMFGTNIRAIVPQMAMSAGTMIACSCREIMMGKQSNIGPVDPQIYGFAAQNYVKGFKRALKAVNKNPETIPFWLGLMRDYELPFIEDCQNVIEWSDNLVKQWLLDNMLSTFTDKEKKKRAKSIMATIGSNNNTQLHDRHIHAAEAQAIGLTITPMEADHDLQDLILTLHHCYMHALSKTDYLKIVENHAGISMTTT